MLESEVGVGAENATHSNSPPSPQVLFSYIARGLNAPPPRVSEEI